jgi:hypothetical protein
MSVNSASNGGLRILKCLCILVALFPGCALAQSQGTASSDKDFRNQPFYLRDFARLAGNIGGWWSFLTENEKGAFLTGYQTAMAQALSQNRILCKVFMDGVKNSNPQQTSITEVSIVATMCDAAKDFTDFDKVTTKDLDGFYSDRVNQPILLEWAMGYLRDKASGRKTEGQLLDALKAEQKDVHDCSKYPNRCKLGAKESQPSQ